MHLEILPLAITMMAGPQIMSAIILVTTRQPVRVSLAFLAGVFVATLVGVAITRGIFALVGSAVSFDHSGNKGSVGLIVQYALVAALIALAVKNFVRRETIEPPTWLARLMEATPRKALLTGLLVILLMPSDIMVMLTVGAHLEQVDAGLGSALPFVGLTVLVAATPLLALVLFHRHAAHAMPRVREWMNSHAWVINVVTCLIFIALIV
ncbi:hypothetical protein GCM10023085_50290 [Actinomadura viridis]|uniref:Small neutral amino acid transporter SnatA (MarC family) n=1 Tax=Actinomadura viridis TaxID=58110 RepID=A0A931GTT6_9ACTN|nr:GAP family protein [Actinomadura viridis]MBG6092389.1 small neutral amino acid transporter SnatA (MarC family) [Actinomadura viridis]